MWQQEISYTWGLEDTCCLDKHFPLLDSCNSRLRSKLCFGIDGCDFEPSGLRITGMEFFALDEIIFFSVEVSGTLEGMPFGAWGRPGPLPLLLPCCFRSIGDIGLLPEANLWGPTLDSIFLLVGIFLHSSPTINILLPLLLDNCLLFSGTWSNLASLKSPKNLYKFSQWK